MFLGISVGEISCGKQDVQTHAFMYADIFTLPTESSQFDVLGAGSELNKEYT